MNYSYVVSKSEPFALDHWGNRESKSTDKTLPERDDGQKPSGSRKSTQLALLYKALKDELRPQLCPLFFFFLSRIKLGWTEWKIRKRLEGRQGIRQEWGKKKDRDCNCIACANLASPSPVCPLSLSVSMLPLPSVPSSLCSFKRQIHKWPPNSNDLSLMYLKLNTKTPILCSEGW